MENLMKKSLMENFIFCAVMQLFYDSLKLLISYCSNKIIHFKFTLNIFIIRICQCVFS